MKFIEPRVIRLAHTTLDPDGVPDFLQAVGAAGWESDAGSEGEQLIELCGRLCYRSWAPGLNANVTKVREGNAAYIANLIAQRHWSVLEHCTVTYAFVGVSRVLTHELCRHRHLSFSQESLRFVRLDELGAYMPMAFHANDRAAEPEPDDVLAEVAEELTRASRKHPPMRSLHEAYAILREELDELWAEIKRHKPDHAAIRAEAVRVAAMATRFVLDLLPVEPAGQEVAEPDDGTRPPRRGDPPISEEAYHRALTAAIRERDGR